MRAAERAVELNPSDPDSLMSLAKAQVRFGAYDEAVANAERWRAACTRWRRTTTPTSTARRSTPPGRQDGGARRCSPTACCGRRDERNCLRIEAVALVRLEPGGGGARGDGAADRRSTPASRSRPSGGCAASATRR